jgi:hypothetical protein
MVGGVLLGPGRVLPRSAPTRPAFRRHDEAVDASAG